MQYSRKQEIALRGSYRHATGFLGVGWYLGIPKVVLEDSRGCFEAR